jgi:hypothetical protein
VVSADRHTVTITRRQLEEWVGRELTDEEVDVLDECIPGSSIPEAIGTIAMHALPWEEEG